MKVAFSLASMQKILKLWWVDTEVFCKLVFGSQGIENKQTLNLAGLQNLHKILFL